MVYARVVHAAVHTVRTLLKCAANSLGSRSMALAQSARASSHLRVRGTPPGAAPAIFHRCRISARLSVAGPDLELAKDRAGCRITRSDMPTRPRHLYPRHLNQNTHTHGCSCWHHSRRTHLALASSGRPCPCSCSPSSSSAMARFRYGTGAYCTRVGYGHPQPHIRFHFRVERQKSATGGFGARYTTASAAVLLMEALCSDRTVIHVRR